MLFKNNYALANSIIQILSQQKRRLAYALPFAMMNVTEQELKTMKQLKHAYLLQSLVRDLLESNLFTLNGLARELGATLEQVTDLFLKRFCNPSYSLAIAIIYLHFETFPKLYEENNEANLHA